MGDVYRARDTRLGRMVAIKFVSDELAADPVASERLTREARLTSLLNHPNIVTVHDVGEIEGRPFIVMELVEGQSLHAALQQERLKTARAIDIACQIADGLAAAHAAGIVHRDLKPRNIMLTEDGRAKIVDFGVGKTNPPKTASDDPTLEVGGLTDAFAVVGTAGYMSPEQVTGRPIDFRADQFALGTIVYEMLTGRRAFKRDSTVQTMAAILEKEPEPMAALAPDAAIEVVTIVERCLAKEPGDRYASTQDLARDLRDVRQSGGSRTSRSAFTLPRAPRRRWPMAAGLVAVLVAAAAIAAYVLRDPTAARLTEARALLDRYDKQANVDRAIDLLSSVVSAASKNPAARTMLAEAYWRKYEYASDATLADRAGEEAGVALTLDQSYAPVHVVLAMINYGQGRYDGASGEAHKALSLDPGQSRAWRELGRVHVRLGRREEAEQAFQTAVKLDPVDWTAHNGLGALLFNSGRLDDAIVQFERVLSLAPDNTRAYNNLGSAYLQQERFDKATEMYERSLSLDKNTTAYSNLGTALYQQGLYADAARSYEGAVALPGATFVHWYNLGAACYWAPDLRPRAKEAYETAIRLGEQPQGPGGKPDPTRLVELASSHAVLGLLTQRAEAATHRERARALLTSIEPLPLDATALSALATTYEEVGDRQRALDLIAQAIDKGYSIKRIERSPWLKELRADPRYSRLRK
jgi:serine/threonine protein kinase/Tfp pilus assembly protein PilF